MVEPFASVVYNTLLSGRSKLNSVARTVVTPSSRTVGPQYFTPQPRRLKGKIKSQDVPEEAPLDRSLREWSSSSSRHLFWWPYELSHGERGAPSTKRRKRPHPRPRIVKSLLTMPGNGQRRHSSNASEGSLSKNLEQPSISDFSRHEQKIKRFERINQLPRSEVDLEEAWSTYQDAVQYDLPLPSKMSFVDKYVSAVEMLHRSRASAEQLKNLSKRAGRMLEDLEPSIGPGTRFDQWRLCLLARSCALHGHYSDAVQAIHDADAIPLPYAHRAGIPYAYEMILTSIMRFEGNLAAMGFIGDEWENLSTHLDFKSSAVHTGAQKRAGTCLRTTAQRVAAEITDPMPFLEKEEWNHERRTNVGCFFIQALAHAHLGLEGREVLSSMQRLHLQVPRHFQYMLVRSLARRPATMYAAVDLFKSLPHGGQDVPYLQLGLHLYARQGAIETAEDFFSSITEVAVPSPEDTAALIHGYAMADNPTRAEEAFEKFFPLKDGKRTNSPTLPHYSAVIYAHAKQAGANQASITRWLTAMANENLVPNEHVFTIVLNAFAAAGDFESTMTVLQQMRKAGVRPNVVTYTIVITLLAHRKDPMGAEALFKRALKEGIVPDNRMIVSVMNAHVEGGSWKGVIRAYDYLMSARITALSLEVYNTLMKAYVLIGAPFSVVYKFFKRLEQSKAKPDAYTYSLLVQSACDAGLMSIAADIYYDMEQLFKDRPERNINANVYILTILMAGFLQHGDKVKAKAVYDEMVELGIHPSPVTFRIILKAYANERSKASLEIAEAFIKTLVAVPEEERTWKKPKYDSAGALHHLYSPVISGYARLNSPEDVERVLQDMQDAGEPTSLGTMTALMDVYRRTFNVDAVNEIWPQVKEFGIQLTSKDWMTPEDGPSEITRGIRGNVLCVPLSIYIDALSAAGQHDDIAAVWKELRTRGFSFDSHNWNHLAVALVRAGQVERAFEVVERVIIPYQELSISSNQARDRNPSSPLFSDAIAERKAREEKEEEEVPNLKPLRGSHRNTAVKISKSKSQYIPGFESDNEDHGNDFAYHLHILHQISPSWATWQAHNATLSVLLMAYNHLSNGRLVKATGTIGNNFDPDESSHAREMLNTIYSQYPKTIQLIIEYDERERNKLGSDEYDKQYTWG
ncbi:hypothetical protein C0991_003584 [Blastosporella zonata]|nr:hypothetical protein C0991_003584 [Blastosporella zonata]